MQENTTIITCTASVILQRENKIMLVQEDKIQSKNLWNLPGGRFEQHESVFDCAIREALEETGYDIHLTALLGIYKYVTYKKYDLIRFVFIANIISEQKKYWTHEIKAHQWLSIDEINKLKDEELLAPNSIRAIINDLQGRKTFPIEAVKWC